MIDLTKPIRRKSDKMRCFVSTIPCHYVEPWVETGVIGHVSRELLERDYENIPEPRKPREWLATVGRDERDLWPGRDYEGERVRVIEWPENVSLPNWPEESA